MKSSMKVWNHDHFWNIHQNISKIEKEMNDLDRKKECVRLSEEERECRRSLQEEFWRNVVFKVSLLKQKSRSNWLSEGESNSKFFHIMGNWRRKNMIRGVNINGLWKKEPNDVKEEALKIFKQIFNEEQ